MIVDYSTVARETRASVAESDALLARLRRSEDLIIGRSDAEIRAARIVELRQECARHAELESMLARWSRTVREMPRR
jgi:cell division septum initiation protein DivIVA